MSALFLQHVQRCSGLVRLQAAATLPARQIHMLLCPPTGLRWLQQVAQAEAVRGLSSGVQDWSSAAPTGDEATTGQAAQCGEEGGDVAAPPKDFRKPMWSAAARQVLGGKRKAKKESSKSAASDSEGAASIAKVAGPKTAVEAGPPPGSPAGPEFSVFEQLRHLDPILQAVALVPWLPDNAEGHSRKSFIKSTVMDQLESKGWDVRGAVYLMWEGERDLATVLEGKDSGTRAALTAILYHCKNLDTELGDFRSYAGGAPQNADV